AVTSGIGRVEEAEWRKSVFERLVDDAGLDPNRQKQGVDRADAAQVLKREDDAAGLRYRAAGKSGPSAAGDERETEVADDADQRDRLVRRFGVDDGAGNA